MITELTIVKELLLQSDEDAANDDDLDEGAEDDEDLEDEDEEEEDGDAASFE